jgi:hypothetical protein
MEARDAAVLRPSEYVPGVLERTALRDQISKAVGVIVAPRALLDEAGFSVSHCSPSTKSGRPMLFAISIVFEMIGSRESALRCFANAFAALRARQ